MNNECRNVANLLDEGLESYFIHEKRLPLVLSPVEENFDLIHWAEKSKVLIADLVLQYGGVLFRGFEISNIEEFEHFLSIAVSSNWGRYQEKATPRTHVKGKVFTATEYLSDRVILPHNENSYVKSWPHYIAFYADIIAETGGETPLIDCREMYQSIPDHVLEPFVQKGVEYVRNYGYGMGLPWKEAYGVESREEMNAYCAENNISIRWSDDDKIQLRSKRWAVITHPITKDKLWFNHGVFFNSHALEDDLKKIFLGCYSKDEIPYNTCYGDGSEIDADTIELLMDLYQKHKIKYPYEKGDVLILDNMRVAHGREAFTGDRKVYVAMMEQVSYEDIEDISRFIEPCLISGDEEVLVF